jgi:opacity protein-like surface antigen
VIAGLLVAVALAAAMPAAAMADASANIRRSPGPSAAFTLAGSDGYSLYFKSEKGQLTIVASQGRPAQPTISNGGKLLPARTGSSSESTYVVHGVSRDPSAIEADLGSAGSVSLTFQPSGEKKVTMIDLSGKSERCIGAAKVVRRLGSFVGSVSFHGENGYTTAEAVSVPGSVGTSTFRNCTHLPKRPASGKAASEPAAFIVVDGETPLLAFRDSGRASFAAFESEELEEGLFVFRSATAVGAPSLFSFRPDTPRASLRPPAPVSGTGIYRDSPSAPPTWSGDLSVSFPGVRQPLTGQGAGKASLKLVPR